MYKLFIYFIEQSAFMMAIRYELMDRAVATLLHWDAMPSKTLILPLA